MDELLGSGMKGTLDPESRDQFLRQRQTL